MSLHWMSGLVRGYETLFAAIGQFEHADDRDADARRLRSELDAIRVRYPESA